MKIFRSKKILVLLIALCLTLSCATMSFAVGNESKVVNIDGWMITVTLKEYPNSFGQDKVKVYTNVTDVTLTGTITAKYRKYNDSNSKIETATASFSDVQTGVLSLPDNGYNTISAEATITIKFGDKEKTTTISFED